MYILCIVARLGRLPDVQWVPLTELVDLCRGLRRVRVHSVDASAAQVTVAVAHMVEKWARCYKHTFF